MVDWAKLNGLGFGSVLGFVIIVAYTAVVTLNHRVQPVVQQGALLELRTRRIWVRVGMLCLRRSESSWLLMKAGLLEEILHVFFF